MIEFERDERKVLRVTAIRDNEELMHWEILDDAKGEKFYRSYNSSKLTSFRWPFFAYAESARSIMVSQFSSPDFCLHHKLDLGGDKKARIIKLDFSNSGNLYILV